MPRRTKIVATLGPATDAPGVLEEMVAAGLNVARQRAQEVAVRANAMLQPKRMTAPVEGGRRPG